MIKSVGGIKKQLQHIAQKTLCRANYLDNPNIPDNDIKGKIPAFVGIIGNLNGILTELEKQGVKISDDDVLNGFVE